MSNFEIEAPTFSQYSFSQRTWALTFKFKIWLDPPPNDAESYYYDFKYFYHIEGGNDPTQHWTNLDGYGIRQFPSQTGQQYYQRYFTTNSIFSAGKTYIFKFELWYCPQNMGWQDSYKKTDPWTLYIKWPLVPTWAWVSNTPNSWNAINVNNYTHNTALDTSAKALQSRGRVDNFYRITWNDIIDWLIHVYKTATNRLDDTSITDESFYPWGTTGRAYISTATTPGPPFTANNWNLMTYIANSVIGVLGGSSSISQVSPGDRIEAHIFSDVTITINELINSYNRS